MLSSPIFALELNPRKYLLGATFRVASILYRPPPPFPGIPLLYNSHLTTNPSLKGTGFLPDGEPEVVALLWISNDSSELLTPSSFLCFLHQMFWSLKWYFLVHVYLSLTKFCWIAKFCTNVCCCTTTGLTLNFRLILLDLLIYIDLTYNKNCKKTWAFESKFLQYHQMFLFSKKMNLCEYHTFRIWRLLVHFGMCILKKYTVRIHLSLEKIHCASPAAWFKILISILWVLRRFSTSWHRRIVQRASGLLVFLYLN